MAKAQTQTLRKGMHAHRQTHMCASPCIDLSARAHTRTHVRSLDTRYMYI